METVGKGHEETFINRICNKCSSELCCTTPGRGTAAKFKYIHKLNKLVGKLEYRDYKSTGTTSAWSKKSLENFQQEK